jgi:hypothetical protein
MMYPSSYLNTFKNGFYDGALDFEQNHLRWIAGIRRSGLIGVERTQSGFIL